MQFPESNPPQFLPADAAVRVVLASVGPVAVLAPAMQAWLRELASHGTAPVVMPIVVVNTMRVVAHDAAMALRN